MRDRRPMQRFFLALFLMSCSVAGISCARDTSDVVVRVFIFAGQSNMVGADSDAAEIAEYPPYVGLDQPQSDIKYRFCIGRERKTISKGWETLKPVNNLVGPELSFGRIVSNKSKGKIAIIKVAAGGTHLGGDWNPDDPQGFKLYPMALKFVKDSLADLERKGVKYRVEGFMWHQGENDMFEEDYKVNYGANLKNYISCWRRDLKCPDLKFYIGELCTKTIWGMDLRDPMHAISVGQKKVAASDEHVEYVPTSHNAVTIGDETGLHYHYGTLGQLQHGECYARAYLNSAGVESERRKPLSDWPYPSGSKVKLFVLAGHRNMEGERAFIQQLAKMPKGKRLLRPNKKVAFKYSIGGGYQVSDGWEPLGPAGYCDTFGPELSFAAAFRKENRDQIAIAKFTHSGSQMIDWTPAGSNAVSRNLYPDFVEFVKDAIAELESKNNEVEIGGILYHVGENDMSWGPFRKQSAANLKALIDQSRIDLKRPNLRWFVTQQPPTDKETVNRIDAVSKFVSLGQQDPFTHHIKVFELKGREKELVLSTAGIVDLGEKMASAVSE